MLQKILSERAQTSQKMDNLSLKLLPQDPSCPQEGVPSVHPQVVLQILSLYPQDLLCLQKVVPCSHHRQLKNLRHLPLNPQSLLKILSQAQKSYTPKMKLQRHCCCPRIPLV